MEQKKQKPGAIGNGKKKQKTANVTLDAGRHMRREQANETRDKGTFRGEKQICQMSVLLSCFTEGQLHPIHGHGIDPLHEACVSGFACFPDAGNWRFMCVINLHMDSGMSSDVGSRTWDADGLGPAPYHA